jgi:biotin carboxyl carrier protein
MKLTAQVGDREREIDVEPIDGGYRVTIDGVTRVVDAQRVGAGSWSLIIAEVSTPVDVDTGRDGDLLVDVRGQQVTVKIVDPRKKLLENAKVARPPSAGPTAVVAPMPGKVVKILCKVGDAVAAGVGLVVVEAMKMENELRAPRAGTVAAVNAREGQAVEGGESLVTIE